MDLKIIQKAGLTESQAKGYLTLVEHGSLTPTVLAELTQETRTNAYAIADKLVALGLATKKDGRPATFTATHPTCLEALAERRRKAITRNEQELKQSLSPLIDLFYAHTSLPGTRTLQGIEGIKEVYADTLKAKQDIYLLRTQADTIDLGLDFLNNYRTERAAAGIHTYALTPNTPVARAHAEAGEDAQMLFHRTLLAPGDYTAPVEIDVYGHKVALIAFGDTQMATIIDSPPIAEAMRQVLRLVGSISQASRDR